MFCARPSALSLRLCLSLSVSVSVSVSLTVSISLSACLILAHAFARAHTATICLGAQLGLPALVAPAMVAAAQDHNATKAAVSQTAQKITSILSDYVVSGGLAFQAVRTESSEKLATARADLLAEVLRLVRASVNEHDGPFQALKSGPRTQCRSVLATRAS